MNIGQPAPLTLLIVDDERDLVEFLVDEFERMGVTCLTAFSGKEALAVLEREMPDAILSDINMPELDGLQMLARIREQGLLTPLVFVTGYADKEKAIKALQLGASDLLEKPIDRKYLHIAVRQALEYGARIKSLGKELDEWCAGEPSEVREKFRETKRELMIMEITRASYYKKVA